jgi:hypothetical protein
MGRESLEQVRQLTNQLAPWILNASDMPSKILALEVGVKFVNATLHRYRIDDDLCEDVSYELNKHVVNPDRSKMDFLYGRMRNIFVRIQKRLEELDKNEK